MRIEMQILARSSTNCSSRDDLRGQRWGCAMGGTRVDEWRVVSGAVGPFVTYLATGNLPPIIWERELFFLGDRPGEHATGVIDVTGRARHRHHRCHETRAQSIG